MSAPWDLPHTEDLNGNEEKAFHTVTNVYLHFLSYCEGNERLAVAMLIAWGSVFNAYWVQD